jgi:hypothetical protein
MKPKLILCLALVLSGILCSFGRSTQILVTPKNLDQGEYVFSVSTNSTQYGISFHVTITAKTSVIFPDSQADLSIVTRQTESSPGSIRTMKQVTLKKEDHTWTADFVTTPDLLKTSGICFVFTAYCHGIENGKTVPEPCADFYELRLLDFLNQ